MLTLIFVIYIPWQNEPYVPFSMEKVSGFKYYSSLWNERLKEELKKDPNFLSKHAPTTKSNR